MFEVGVLRCKRLYQPFVVPQRQRTAFDRLFVDIRECQQIVGQLDVGSSDLVNSHMPMCSSSLDLCGIQDARHGDPVHTVKQSLHIGGSDLNALTLKIQSAKCLSMCEHDSGC